MTRRRLPTVALALGLTLAIAAAAVLVADLTSHAGASASARAKNAGAASDAPVRAPSAEAIARSLRSPCVVTVTKATVCGRAAADYCNLVTSHAMSLGPAETSRCGAALRQWMRELSRTYELNEEAGEIDGGS